MGLKDEPARPLAHRDPRAPSRRHGLHLCPRLRDLRHTAASHMMMRAASLKEVQEILGHSDFKMTLRYAHLSPAHLRGAVDRLDGLTPVPAGQSWAHKRAQNGKIVSADEQAASEVSEISTGPRSSGG